MVLEEGLRRYLRQYARGLLVSYKPAKDYRLPAHICV